MASPQEKIKAVTSIPFSGVTIDVGSFKLVIPPLVAKQMRKFAGDLDKISKFTDATTMVEGLDLTIPIIHAALARNYPDLTTDDVEELVDAKIYKPVIKAVMGQSGFKEGEPGES